ncbi:MAG: hypothetical protein U9O56_05675 [Campylobacterota bacterium]|nr:hypothetical protein [Campylobacterota bacterium]
MNKINIKSIFSYNAINYQKQIKKVKNKTIKFHDKLKLKFIDLNIGKQTVLKKDNAKNLGLKIIEPNINISQKQATFVKVQNKELNNDWLKKRVTRLALGLESLDIGDVLINRILMARDETKYKRFISIDDFKKRVPIINDTDKKIQKIVFDNLQIDLDKMTKLKENLKNYKEENRN